MPASRLPLPTLPLLLAFALPCGPWSKGALAQEGFNPFAAPEPYSRPARKDSEQPSPAGQPYLSPMTGPSSGAPTPAAASGATPAPAALQGRPEPVYEKGLAIERADLAPVMAEDGSGLPYELWRGLSLADVEALIASLDIPPKSVALHALWRRLITSAVTAPGGADSSLRFTALRVEALDRSGLLDEAADLLAKEPSGKADPVIAALTARSEAGAGNRDRACELAKSLVVARADLPPRLKGETVLIAGYCALAAGDTTAAEVSASLAGELLDERAAGPDILAAAASGTAPAIADGRKIGLIDVRILELKGGVDAALLRGNATPAVLSALARAPTTAPALRLAAGEAAAAVNAIAPADLAAVYRAQAVPPGTPASAETAAGMDVETRRAALFKAAEAERTPLKKARLIRAFLDTARHAGLYWPALELMAGPAQELTSVPEIGWFAETAIETSLAVGNFERARAWAAFSAAQSDQDGPGRLSHWIALADIADPAAVAGQRSAHLASVERMALDGRFDPALLHRLATVLDALDIAVPMPLWDAASRAPQPAGGHLPDTGELTDLLDASKKKEFGRTVLLAMRALGPDGAEGAHIIALGDSIRALRRAGLEADARRLGFEALFAAWPRSVSN